MYYRLQKSLPSPPPARPGQPWAAVEDEAENSPGAPEPHDQLQRCGKETGGAQGPRRAGSCPRPGLRAGPASAAPRTRHRQQHPRSESQGSGSSAGLLVREKNKPEPSRVNFSSSQAPVHIGEHRHKLLRPRHRFNLQPQVRWICQKKPRKGVMSTQCT